MFFSLLLLFFSFFFSFFPLINHTSTNEHKTQITNNTQDFWSALLYNGQRKHSCGICTHEMKTSSVPFSFVFTTNTVCIRLLETAVYYNTRQLCELLHALVTLHFKGTVMYCVKQHRTSKCLCKTGSGGGMGLGWGK